MKIVISLFLILLSINAFAHQPKLIKYSPTKENPHKVINPEISKAYYAKLKGEQAAQEEMKNITGGLPLPPGMKLPF